MLCVWEQTPPHSDSHPLESPGALKYHLPCSLTAGVRPPEASHGETGRREAGVHGYGGPWARGWASGGLRVRPRPSSPCGSGFQQIRRLRNQEPPGRTCAGCGQSAELEETWWPQGQRMGGGRGEEGAGAGPEGRRPGGRGHLTRARSLVTPREAAARPSRQLPLPSAWKHQCSKAATATAKPTARARNRCVSANPQASVGRTVAPRVESSPVTTRGAGGGCTGPRVQAGRTSREKCLFRGRQQFETHRVGKGTASRPLIPRNGIETL